MSWLHVHVHGWALHTWILSKAAAAHHHITVMARQCFVLYNAAGQPWHGCGVSLVATCVLGLRNSMCF